MQSSSKISRSVYVAQLRRAFLLRAHPDRFRKHDDSVRKGQVHLLQALSNRMHEQDFQDYTSNTATATTNTATRNFQQNGQSYPFVLEKRDGTLLHLSLKLNEPVQSILTGMFHALQTSGVTSLPPPPPPPPSLGFNSDRPNKEANNPLWPKDMAWAASSSTINKPSIDHRFDLNTTKGRDFKGFLKSLCRTQIEERRASRMDASAAALMTRKLFSFQAVDGISMGWSSASFAVLLSSLNDLHEEHSSTFHVQSFYPLRLVFSSEDFFFEQPLDLYGGIIYLNPGWTPLQWLEPLQEVTEASLELLQQNRQLLAERTTIIQNALGVRIKKGFSCPSKPYHEFLERLSESALPSQMVNHSNSSYALTLERILLTVESPQVCRRSKVTSEGTIRIHSNMTITEVFQSISKHSTVALSRRQQEREQQEMCKQIIHDIQWEFGLQKVYRRGMVTHDEFIGALSRMMEQKPALKDWLPGYSIGIIGTGQFCHLSDDGSLMIPHNWN